MSATLAPASPAPPVGAPDQIDRLPHGERWFIDGFAVIPTPGGLMSRLCDATHVQSTLAALRAAGLAATYTHIFVRAIALALLRQPSAHQIVCGYRRLRPGTVDIGLSVAGQTNYAPVLVIPRASERALPDLVQFLTDAVPATREKEARDLAGMNRNGWIIPIGAVRRFILRLLQRTFWFRRRLIGTFQVTCLPQVDQVWPVLIYSGAAIGVGRVTDRVLAIAGQPTVRPTVCLTVTFDHQTMDGRIAGDLLAEVARILESDELLRETRAHPSLIAEHMQPTAQARTALGS
jgi:pyruvate/2-oxoglutarate dehydrogenase complex dihydrolipoamide acyltransferase (E2) component